MILIDRENIKKQIQRYLIPNTDDSGMVSVEDAERYFLSLLDKEPVIKTPEWNRSESKLPVEEQRLLGFDGNCQLGDFICIYTFRDGMFYDDEGFSYTISEVTHWCSTPELPNEIWVLRRI